MPYDPQRHHRRSIRLPDCDYRSPGMYYVTLCAYERGTLFGEVIGGEVQLNASGQIVADTWRWLATRYPYLSLDAWVIMPDHLHGIIAIGDAPCEVSDDTEIPAIKPLGQIIGAFKTVSTKAINDGRDTPGMAVWQRNFWEHIIRNQVDHDRVRAYIQDNPRRWSARRC